MPESDSTGKRMPAMASPAIKPEATNVPRSPNCVFSSGESFLRPAKASATHLSTPPTKIAQVVSSGSDNPTAISTGARPLIPTPTTPNQPPPPRPPPHLPPPPQPPAPPPHHPP